MSASSPPDHDDMAEGLKAAFAGEPELQRPSVLRLLKEKTGSRLDLHLHAADEESDVPVKIDDDAKALRDPTGRYQVLGEIGRGGVGVVYKGRDQDLGRDVALKVLRPEHVSRPEIVERFVEEAQIGGQLQHPGIVPVYEIGLQAGERPYFAMKLVKGHTLAELLAQRRSPDEDRRRFLGIFEQVCQTVAYAHARRVVHRDLKPQNVMLGSFGEVQVVDWGFAKVLPKTPAANAEGAAPKPATHLSVIATVRSDPKKGSHSVVGSMMGTPAYMPLEQALGDVEHMDQRSDVFGLGAILCEILTGQPPYVASSGDLIQQAARAELQNAYERLERCGADAVLITLCKQCLAPARQARPDSAKQVAESMAQYLTSVEERAREAQIHAAEAKVRARSTLMLSAAAVLLLALAGGGYLYLQHESQARRTQANERVAIALNETNVRLGEARSKTPPDLDRWERTVDAAKQAELLASEADVESEPRSRVARMLETVHGERATAIAAAAQLDRDAAMVQRLLQVRVDRLDDEGSDFNLKEHRRRVHASAAAFADYLGARDLTTMDREQAVQALSGPLAVEWASGLDYWCASRRYVAIHEPVGAEPDDAAARKAPESKPEPEVTARLSDLASAIDDNPWRVRMRAALTATDRDHDAIVTLSQEADLETLPATSLLLLAQGLVDVAEPAAALKVLERACARFPADFSCVFQLGITHLNGGSSAAAEMWLRAAHALRPDLHAVLHQVGNALAGLGKRREEEALFRRLLELEPANAHWAHHVGQSLVAQGRLDEAITACQLALDFDPGNESATLSLATAYEQQGRLDDAIAAVRRAIEAHPRSANLHMNLGKALVVRGTVDDGIASFRRSLELEPESAQCLANLGNALLVQNKIDDAIAILRRAIEVDPDYAMSHLALADAWMRQGRLDDAASGARRAIELDPKASSPHYDLARVLGLQGRADDAIASYRRAIELGPTDARYHMNLGNVLADTGQLDEALACYRRAEAIWNEGTDAYSGEWLRNVRMALGELQPMIERRKRLLAILRGERESKNAVELSDAGGLGCERGDDRLALHVLQLAIELEPGVGIYHYNAGIAFDRLGRIDDSIASYERAIELDPKDARFHGNLANALVKRGDVEDAIACCRESIELDPKNVGNWLRLGDVLLQAGENDEAIACVRNAVDIDPSSAVAHHDLGYVLALSGRPAEALPCFRKALELSPWRVEARFDLAFVLLQLGQDAAALDCFRKAVDLDPKNAETHHRLGCQLQALHRWDEAAESFQQAIELDPDHAEAHCNLASCLQDLGRFDEGLQVARRGHELGSKRAGWSYPSAKWVRQAETRLALEPTLSALLAGTITPADNDERLAYAKLCSVKKLHREAARLIAEVLAADPRLADDLGAEIRLEGAISSALAAGRCEDDARLDEEGRSRLRKQSLEWLRADLTLHARRLESGKPSERATVMTALRHWQEEPAFASIRDAAAVDSLPPEDRDACRRLWADVAELVDSR